MFCLVFFRWGNRAQTFRGIPGIYLTNGALAVYTAMIFAGHLVAVRRVEMWNIYLLLAGKKKRKKERTKDGSKIPWTLTNTTKVRPTPPTPK